MTILETKKIIVGATALVLAFGAVALHADMSNLFKRYEEDPADAAWFIRFTTSGFLDRVNPGKRK